MDQLSVIETVTLSGRNGDCVVELFTGDLSKLHALPIENSKEASSCPTAVDLLIVCNEERGDSSKTKTTSTSTSTNLIRNLGSNQQIYLEELSKEEDLRDCLNCWISCPLNKSINNDNNSKNNKSPFIPFQRILTWEPSIDTLKVTSNSNGAIMAVESIFAAIIAMARNSCRTIVMPLLGLSDDKTSQYNMLEAILAVTRKWIKRGLAIERLCIVITETDTAPPEELIDVFKKQSEKLTGSRRKRVREEGSWQETAGNRLKKEDELIGIAEPGESDVLCLRGGRSNYHRGNQTYRRLVNHNQRIYMTCRITEKLKISRSVVAAVRNNGGRFLERNTKEGTWYDIGDKRAIGKTSQALRSPNLREDKIKAELFRQSVNPQDVLCGLNKYSLIHPGNSRFRKIIEGYRVAYQSAPSRDHKIQITIQIVAMVRGYGGRFLKLEKDNSWVDVGDMYAREKVSHALRSAKDPKRPRIKKVRIVMKHVPSQEEEKLYQETLNDQQQIFQELIEEDAAGVDNTNGNIIASSATTTTTTSAGIGRNTSDCDPMFFSSLQVQNQIGEPAVEAYSMSSPSSSFPSNAPPQDMYASLPHSAPVKGSETGTEAADNWGVASAPLDIQGVGEVSGLFDGLDSDIFLGQFIKKSKQNAKAPKKARAAPAPAPAPIPRKEKPPPAEKKNANKSTAAVKKENPDSFFAFGQKEDSDSDSDGEITSPGPAPAAEVNETASPPAEAFASKHQGFSFGGGADSDDEDNDEDMDEVAPAASWSLAKPATESQNNDDEWGAARNEASAARARDGDRKKRLIEMVKAEAQQAKLQSLAGTMKEADEQRRAAREAVRSRVRRSTTEDLDAQRNIMDESEESFTGPGPSPATETNGTDIFDFGGADSDYEDNDDEGTDEAAPAKSWSLATSAIDARIDHEGAELEAARQQRPNFGNVAEPAPKEPAMLTNKKTIILSFAKTDSAVATLVSKALELFEGNFSVVAQAAKLSPNMFEAEGIQSDVLGKASRVIALITPNYVRDLACLHQFNECLLTETMNLQPVLMEDTNLPKYLQVVQFHDARSGRDKLFQALSSIICSMENEKKHETKPVTPTYDSVNKKVDDDFVSSGVSFDIFVSYASKMRAQANSAVEILQHLRPDIKYFVDVNELHAGARWQQTLYDALDSTRLVLFILTPAFLKSTFCHEEAAIAALRDMEGCGDVIAVEAIPTDQAQKNHLPRAVANSLVKNETLYDACRRALKRLDNPRQDNDNVTDRTFETRRLLHKSKMTSLYEVNEERKNGSQRPGGPVGSLRLCIVGHPSNQPSLTRIQRKIESRVPTKYSVRILLPKDHDMTFIDSARTMICVLSKDFLRSEFCMNALNIGILRNRTDGGYLIPIAIEHLDPLSTPSFIRLLPTVDASSWVNCDNEEEENFVIQELIVAAAEMSWKQQWKDHTTLIDVCGSQDKWGW